MAAVLLLGLVYSCMSGQTPAFILKTTERGHLIGLVWITLLCSVLADHQYCNQRSNPFLASDSFWTYLFLALKAGPCNCALPGIYYPCNWMLPANQGEPPPHGRICSLARLGLVCGSIRCSRMDMSVCYNSQRQRYVLLHKLQACSFLNHEVHIIHM